MILKRQATSSPARIIWRAARDESFGTTGRAHAVVLFLLNKHVWQSARAVLGGVVALHGACQSLGVLGYILGVAYSVRTTRKI
jgi:hypothetical protein